MRQRKKKIILIAAAFLIVMAVVLAVCLLRPRTSDVIETPSQDQPSDASGQQTEPSQDPIDLGFGLKLTALSEVTGNFPEDGSDEFVESMLSATFQNEGDQTIQYASVQVIIGEEEFAFEFTTLPAGESVRVFEADRKELAGSPNAVSAEIESIAYFQEEPSIYENELEITVADGLICVKNISGKDIDKEISVFYKTASDDMYIGGITYRLRIPAGLPAGEEFLGNAIHASETMSKVMFVTYGE